MKITNYYRGLITERALWVVVKHLPPGSRTKAAINGDPSGQQWGTTQWQLNRLINEVSFLNRNVHLVGRIRDRRIPEYHPSYGPGQEVPDEAYVSPEDELAISLLPGGQPGGGQPTDPEE